MDRTPGKVAVITGANAGVGLGIIQRLLEAEKEQITIVMACRNHGRASQARDELLIQYPFATIEILVVDVSSPSSVLQFCASIQEKFNHINYLFCNAGVLGATGINWPMIPWILLTDPVGFLEKSDATIQAQGEINDEGMGAIFSANVFGHFIMARELEPMLHRSGDGRVIWTSSITATMSNFDIDDWQGIKSRVPYEASKWACDLIAIASNGRYSEKNLNISSFTTSPGVVASSIGNLPEWITKLRIVLHYTVRTLGLTSQNITGYRGAIADVYVAQQPLSMLNYNFRYNALTSRWGTSYVGIQALNDYDRTTADRLISNCEAAYMASKAKYAAVEKAS